MPQKPVFPPSSALATVRGVALHVQSSLLRAAQAKLPERSPRPAGGALPVQPALARVPPARVGPAGAGRSALRPAMSKGTVQLASTGASPAGPPGGSGQDGKKGDEEKKKAMSIKAVAFVMPLATARTVAGGHVAIYKSLRYKGSEADVAGLVEFLASCVWSAGTMTVYLANGIHIESQGTPIERRYFDYSVNSDTESAKVHHYF